jgi:transposase
VRVRNPAGLLARNATFCHRLATSIRRVRSAASPTPPQGVAPARLRYIRAETAEHGTFANVPPRVIRKRTFVFSPWLYRQRNQIERFFNRIKQMRGLATRYDRRLDNFFAAIKLDAARIWINAV